MAQLRINLLPPRVRQARARRAMIVIGATVALAVLAVPVALLYVKWAAVASLRQRVQRVDEESKAFAGVIEKIVATDTQEAELIKKLDIVDKLTARQALWIRFLEMLNGAQQRAKDLWLNSVSTKVLAGKDQGTVEAVVIGAAFSLSSIDEFERALTEGGTMPVTVVKIDATGGQVGNERAINFTATLRVKY